MAVICLILGDYYYWFNSKWSNSSMVFEMKDGEGNHFHILFNKYG